MKKQFTKQEIIDNRGCYDLKQVEKLSFINNEIILLTDILKSEISIKDKRWFFWNKCDVSLDDKKQLVLKFAWVVLPIYENKYPSDKRVRECLEATELFYKGKISKDELIVKRKAAYAAATATDAAAYAVYAAAAYTATAADGAAYNAAYAADAADAAAVYTATAAYADAYNAAYAAYAADDAKISYSKQIENLLIEFVENN